MFSSGRSFSTRMGSAMRFWNARKVARSVMVYARRSLAMPRVAPIPCPDSMYHGAAGSIPACFQSVSSRAWVPDLSPRETKREPVAASFFSASTAFGVPLILAGSSSGPMMTKSLYMTSRRFSILPSSTNFLSSAGAWARVTSASPRAARARAWPVPTEMVLTLRPLCFSNIGTSTSSSPESWVLVVVERITVLDCAVAGAGSAAGALIASRRKRLNGRMRDRIGRIMPLGAYMWPRAESTGKARLRDGLELDDEPAPPVILPGGARPDLPGEAGLFPRVDHPRAGVEPPNADPDARARVGAEVLHPLGALAVLGDDVEAALEASEPDLDLAREPGMPAARGEVEVEGLAHARNERVNWAATWASRPRRKRR